MYFKLLPDHIKEAIQNLTVDETFQKRFANDKRLDEIDELKENKGEEYKALLSVYGQHLVINSFEIPNITPAIWSYLWVCDSPFISSMKKPKEIDIDFFMYVLYNGVKMSPSEVFSNSIKFCENKLKISYVEALSYIITIIKYAFRPLKLFPASGGMVKKVSFDADWLTSLVARVHNVTGYSPEYIMNEMSLTACCYYFAQYARIQGAENVYKRTDEEILILQNERTVEMICERLIELNIFPEEEYEKWKKVMVTKP